MRVLIAFSQGKYNIMQYKVFELTGEHAITFDEGQKLYELLEEWLRAGHEVELNFAGVKIFAAPFFNAAIGQLYNEHSAEFLNCSLKITNLSSVGVVVLSRVSDNSKIPPANSPTDKEVLEAFEASWIDNADVYMALKDR